MKGLSHPSPPHVSNRLMRGIVFALLFSFVLAFVFWIVVGKVLIMILV